MHKLAVSAVEKFGTINSSNALDIYTAWRKGEVDLSASQQAYTKHFLTQEQMDNVDYDTGNSTSKELGKKAIDTDGADASGNQTGNAVATTAGNLAAIVGFAALLPALDGFSSLAFSLVCMGFGVVQTTLAKLFDSAYSDRTEANSNADDTNATIEGYNEALVGTMDSMNEDMDAYQSASDQYTLDVNTNTSAIADLQIQLADAQSAGDTAQVKSLKEQISQAQKADFSGQEDELTGLSDKLDEYSANNDESAGVAEAGRTVSDFLKEGYVMGALALVNGAADLVAAAVIASGFVSSTPKLPFGIDIPANIAGKVNGAVAAGVFAGAGAYWVNKGTKELECGSAGDNMGSTTASLESMIAEQGEYIGTTGDTYTEINEASEETQAEAQQKANQSVSDNTKGNGPTKTNTKSKTEDEENVSAVA